MNTINEQITNMYIDTHILGIFIGRDQCETKSVRIYFDPIQSENDLTKSCTNVNQIGLLQMD